MATPEHLTERLFGGLMEGAGHAAGIPCAMPVKATSAMANETDGHAESSTGKRMASMVSESKWSTEERQFLGDCWTHPEPSTHPSARRDASCFNHSHNGVPVPIDTEAPPAAGGRDAGIGVYGAAVDGPVGQPALAAGIKRGHEAMEELEPCVPLCDATVHAKVPKLEPRDEVEGGEDRKSSSPDTVPSLDEQCSYSTADLEVIIEQQSREIDSSRADRQTFAAQTKSAWLAPHGEGQAEQRADEVSASISAADEASGTTGASEQSPSDEAASFFSCGLEALSEVAAQASQEGEKLPKPPKVLKPTPAKSPAPKPKVEPVTSPRCHSCGATETPKWRCAMTLCNACGLRASESRKSKAIRPTQLVGAHGMMGMQLQMAMPQMAGGVHPCYTMMPGTMMHPYMGAMPQCAMPMAPMPGQTRSYPTAMATQQMGVVPRPGYSGFNPNQVHAASSIMSPYGVVGAQGGLQPPLQPFGNHASAADPFAPAAAAGSCPCSPFASHGAPFCAPSAAGAPACGGATMPSCGGATMDGTQQLH